MMYRSIFLWFIVVSLLDSSFADYRSTLIESLDTLKWERVAPGVWKTSIGESNLSPMDFADEPRLKALKHLGNAKFPFSKKDSRGLVGKRHVQVRLPLEVEERLYGLGLEFKGANRRGQVLHLKVDHYGGVKGYTHAPVPFYVSSKGYGVLFNTADRPTIHAGISNRKDSKLPSRHDRTTSKEWRAHPLSDAVEASVQGSGLEVYVFGGESPLEAVQRYNLYCGGGALPPRWGLGFWHRMHTKSSDADVYREIEEFRGNDFPLEVIGLEPGWQSASYPCTFDWDTGRFSNPDAFLDRLSGEGIRINLWENPYVHPDSTLYDAIKPYTGSHTVWLGEVPDYSMPEARAALLEHHQKNHISKGVSGYKFDEVDGFDRWLWPDYATFPSGTDAIQMRQLYGLMLQKTFMDHYRSLNQRTYGLVRASNGGASSMSFAIYSDHYDHKGYVAALTNSSFAGILWTPEIRSAKSPEEWVRRFQTVCFSPMMLLNAWYSGTKPWSFPEVTDMVRDTIELRMRLVPYLYSAFADYNRFGIPPFRSILLEQGFGGLETVVEGELDGVANPYAESRRLEVTDQYMMGPSVLVAPMFAGEKSRKVVLPQGDWFDFYTGELVGNGETIEITVPLEKTPLFVKDGGIVPLMPPTENLSQQGNGIPLEIRHYGDLEATYSFYDDDGESFDYEGGAFSEMEFRATKQGDWLLGSSSKSRGSWKTRYGEAEWKFMTK